MTETSPDGSSRGWPGYIEVTWLGQAGVSISSNRTTILIDPWLSPHPDRLADAAPLTGGRDRVSALLATHEHADHLDLPALPALVANNPGMELVVPEPLVEMVRASVGTGARIVNGVRPGDKLDIARALGHSYACVAWQRSPWRTAILDGGWRATGVSRFVGYALTHFRPYLDLPFWGHGPPHITSRFRCYSRCPGRHPAGINGRDFYRERRGSVGNLDAAGRPSSSPPKLVPGYSYPSITTWPGEIRRPRGAWSTWPLSEGARSPHPLPGPGRAGQTWRGRSDGANVRKHKLRAVCLSGGALRVPRWNSSGDYEAFCQGKKLADPYPLLRRLHSRGSSTLEPGTWGVGHHPVRRRDGGRPGRPSGERPCFGQYG